MANRLEEWFAEHQRPMPWRKSRDPYRIWLSEIMLQQTRVDTVIPYYEKFTEAFPKVEDLAKVPLDQVLSLWAGLGYYARARSLHKAAKIIATDLGGKFPAESEDLRALPGIGPYTAGAIASIAFNRPEPAVDGNVVRVLSRLLAWEADTADPKARVAAEPFVQKILEQGKPAHLTQALMELGATVCLPAVPTCPDCPLRRSCKALAQEEVEKFPKGAARKKPRSVRLVALALRDKKGRVLLFRRAEAGLFGGLWEIPHAETGKSTPAKALAFLSNGYKPMNGTKPHKIGRLTHVLTHRRLETELYELQVASPAGKKEKQGRWVHPADPAGVPLSTFQKKLLGLLPDL